MIKQKIFILIKDHYILFLILITLFQSACTSGSSDSSHYYEDMQETEEELYPDGEYCAEVEYYNPNTGTRSTYTLNVHVS